MDLYAAFQNLPIDHWSAPILVAGSIVIAVIQRRNGKKLTDISRKAGVAAEQTANTHDANLRDDLDGKHDEIVDGQKVIIEMVKELGKTVESHTRRLDNFDERFNTAARAQVNQMRAKGTHE